MLAKRLSQRITALESLYGAQKQSTARQEIKTYLAEIQVIFQEIVKRHGGGCSIMDRLKKRLWPEGAGGGSENPSDEQLAEELKRIARVHLPQAYEELETEKDT